MTSKENRRTNKMKGKEVDLDKIKEIAKNTSEVLLGKGNKMTSVLEGMRVVYFNGVWDLTHYNSKKIFIEKENRYVFETYVTLRKDGESVIIKDDPWKPLLRFPDKDSEAWDCDLFEYEGGYFLLNLNKAIWEIIFLSGHELGDVTVSFDTTEDYIKVLNKANRKCSLYDPKALEFLPEDVVSKLKEEVE